MTLVRRTAQLAEALLAPTPDIDRETEWWRGAMFYEVYVRSFRDSSGDGIGDLAGVVEKLDYLASLNVDGIWLSPIYRSPQEDFGYDVCDFTSVDPIHGSLDDLVRLIEGAHERDLKLLLDFVPCHSSDAHPWFQESRRDRDNPRADWYVWADAAPDGGPPNNWLSSFGGPAWTWEPHRAQYYYHPFLKCQPALNLRHPEVLRAIEETFAFWLDLGVDGFRIDAIQCLCWDPDLRSNPARGTEASPLPFGGGPDNPFTRQNHVFDRDLPHSLEILAALRRVSDRYDPPRVLIGELADVDSATIAVKYTAGPGSLHAVYDFSLINSGETWQDWLQVIKDRSDRIGPGWLMSCLTNHDSARAVSTLTDFACEAGLREDAAKALFFLQATLRGGSIVFQGEELGLPQPDLDYEDLRDPWGRNLWPDFIGRDGVRTPLPWQKDAPNAGFSEGDEPWMRIGTGHAPLAVDQQEDRTESCLSVFRDLLAWRRRNPIFRFGDEEVEPPTPEPVLRYRRYDGGRAILCLINFSTVPRDLELDEGRLLDVPGSTVRTTRTGLSFPPMAYAAVEVGPRTGEAPPG